MSPQTIDEMSKLGYIKEKPHGKVLTAAGYRKLMERNEMLQLDSSSSSSTGSPLTEIGKVHDVKFSNDLTERTINTPPPSITPDANVVSPSKSSPNLVQATQQPLSSPTLIETTVQTALTANNAPAAAASEVIEYCACAAEQFGGPANAYYLCRTSGNEFIPIDRRVLYLENNRLVEQLSDGSSGNLIEQQQQQATAAEVLTELNTMPEITAQSFIINTGDGQQIILDQQSLTMLAAGEMPQLITADGQQIILQATPQDIISALAVNQGELGLFGSGDHQIIINQQDFGGDNSTIAVAYQPSESLIGDVLLQQQTPQPHQTPSDLVVNQTISTDTVLTNPIMSTLEVPTKKFDRPPPVSLTLEGGPNSIEDSLAVIGVTTTNSSVPSSLELPITVTNPAIVSKTSPLNINTIYNTPSIVGPISQISPSLGYDLFDTSSSSSSKTLISSTHESVAMTTMSNFSASIIPEQLLNTQRELMHLHHQQQQEHDDPILDAADNNNIIPQSPEAVGGGTDSSLLNAADDSSSLNAEDDDVQPGLFAPDDDINSNQSDEIPIQPNLINQSFQQQQRGEDAGDVVSHNNEDGGVGDDDNFDIHNRTNRDNNGGAQVVPAVVLAAAADDDYNNDDGTGDGGRAVREGDEEGSDNVVGYNQNAIYKNYNNTNNMDDGGNNNGGQEGDDNNRNGDHGGEIDER